MTKKFLFLIILCSLFFVFPAKSESIEVFEGAWRVIGIDPNEIEGAIVGAGMLYSTSVYSGDDDKIWGVPIIIGKYKRFFINGNSAGVILNDNETIILSAMIEPRFDGCPA